MAIDTAKKRASCGGIAYLPLTPGVTPTASPDQAWRQTVGWSYAGITAQPPSTATSHRIVMGKARMVQQLQVRGS